MQDHSDQHTCGAGEVPATLPGLPSGAGPTIIEADFVGLTAPASAGGVTVSQDVIFRLLSPEEEQS